ncbi:hypothetical protein [Numidum massiliense]|uniref:hypothetical protein n=1 Tax=Numidum massiliense TaxID=1522315 RepID=UPI0006D561D9|nr:hypothetical protein [Numidum massiliense]
MAEKSMFFNSVEGDRVYDAEEFASYFRRFMADGVYKDGAELKVTANGQDMRVTVGTGSAVVDGYMYINTTSLALTIGAADASLDRIDRIVVRVDKNVDKRYVRAFVKKGTAAANPKPPSLTNTEQIKEIAIAQVTVKAGKSFIEQSQIKDERQPINFVVTPEMIGALRAKDGKLLGYLDADNHDVLNTNRVFLADKNNDKDVYGVTESPSTGDYNINVYKMDGNKREYDRTVFRINQEGTVSYPYQPLVWAYADKYQKLLFQTWTKLQFKKIRHSRGTEYKTSNSRYTAKVSGYYLVNGYVELDDRIQEGAFELAVYRNGSNYSRLGYVRPGSRYPIGVNGTGMVYLNVGDYIELYLWSSISTFTRVRGMPSTRFEVVKLV